MRAEERDKVNLTGKVAIVTGSGRGIGEAIAQKMAMQGVNLALWDKNKERVMKTASLIESSTGGCVKSYAIDITQYDAIQAAVKEVLDDFGRIDILVNNAGWDVVEYFLDNKPELFSSIVDLNLKAHMNCCHCVLPFMIESGGGKIINISSEAGRVGGFGEVAYSAAKGGLIAFTKALAQEIAQYGICINSVAPGPTETPMLKKGVELSQFAAQIMEDRKKQIPFNRFARPDEIADAVIFFASSMSDYVTGQVLSVSGGLTMVG